MRNFIVLVLLGCIALLSYQQYRSQVYISFSDEQPDSSRGDKTLYFWASNRHSALFQVGKTYQLSANRHITQLELSSVTYAEIEPDLLKLGFKLPQSETFVPAADKYVVMTE